MSPNVEVSLVIFTCESREHLLKQTYQSFIAACPYSFTKIILAIDGTVNSDLSDFINPDLVIKSPVRKGYVNNILNALPNIETDYFFWLEDDWSFNKPVDIQSMQNALQSNPRAIEVVLGKDELSSENMELIKDDFYVLNSFSANPALCKTRILSDAFIQLKMHKKDDSTKFTGFENFLTGYMNLNGLTGLVLIHTNSYVSHSGYLESTSREYHMINSIDSEKSDIGNDYISGFGSDREIAFKSKLTIVPKLLSQVFKLTSKSFSSRRYYDMALRTYIALANFNRDNNA